jgi:hypothetical protein
LSATCIHKSGVRLHTFADGAMGIMQGDQALHLAPDQAEALTSFVRMLDKYKAPRTVLTDASDIVYGDREKTHGEPGKNLEAIASMWRPIFGTSVTPEQVCLAMIALKVARAVNSPGHRDHWLDIVGYVALAERCGYIAKE